jgi:hypothetical protein
LRARWLGLQQRQVSRCRVFVIPCVAVRDSGGGGGGFAVARPVFDVRWLRPLQRLADAYPRGYFGSVFLFLFVLGLVLWVFIFRGQAEAQSISALVFSFFICIAMLGFLSSKRYGLDRVAAKHVALSFRFAVIVALLATDVALTARRVYTIGLHPTVAFAFVFLGLAFCLCVLLDCSPQMPPSAQIFLSVSAHSDACLRVRLLNPSAGRMVDLFRLSNCFCISACFGWRRCKTRLFHHSQNIQVLRCDSAAFPLH